MKFSMVLVQVGLGFRFGKESWDLATGVINQVAILLITKKPKYPH